MIARVLLLVAALCACACAGPSEAELLRAVRAYDDALIEAYRTADATLLEPVAGPREAKKLLGLIGAKLDMGVTLDAELVSLEPAGVERTQDGATVHTREVWRYADRRAGSGAPVGEASQDHYLVAYLLARRDARWVVEEVRFDAAPQVGRKTATSAAPPSAFHGAGPGGAP